jgi:3-deoxy-D-manno-octulosonate 8-phosphate phosphatase (KDO 8-P phosphatase)
MISSEQYEKLKKLRVLVLDVDGVLTDGRIFWVEGTGWTRFFSVKDGYGLKLLMKSGVQVGIISGGDSQSVRERGKFLGVQHIYLGDENKIVAYEKIKTAINAVDEEMAFVGDELFDIPVLKMAGFSATVPHAVHEVKAVVGYISSEQGGMGAVREIADMIRYAKEGKSYEDFKKIYEKSAS